MGVVFQDEGWVVVGELVACLVVGVVVVGFDVQVGSTGVLVV